MGEKNSLYIYIGKRTESKVKKRETSLSVLTWLRGFYLLFLFIPKAT